MGRDRVQRLAPLSRPAMVRFYDIPFSFILILSFFIHGFNVEIIERKARAAIKAIPDRV
jgi:hypothetical protein